MGEGHCIACGTTVPRNTKKPLCFDCWVVAHGTDEAVQGLHCHSCGKPDPTTIDRPLCEACYVQTHLVS